MKQLLILLALTLSFVAFAQKEIPLEEVANHIGDSVTVRSKIKGVRYVPSAVNSPTFINLGGPYPRQTLTIVIWGEVRKKLGYVPEQKPYSDGVAKVSGKIELFRGKPQIVIVRPEQFIIIYDEEVSPIMKKQ
jgi:hypothetical protein